MLATLRDFIGYHLMLDNLQIRNVGGDTEISFVITNYGLGTPLTINDMQIIVADKVENTSDITDIKRYYVSSYDSKKLITYGQQKITFTVKGGIENKAIGVALSRGNYNIKTANDIMYKYGVNFIKY